MHNWQQEVSRFVPDFKVIPYWGSPQERKILRQFWSSKNLHRRDAGFHLVITSYQLVITDFKYFNRQKWQYLILDEAQAIKSSASQRWKMLLEFKCRNRLLLSGTPIQNTMAELWSLLHFVMPTLFDNHEEFADWFSKDIESSAENKAKQVDEAQISRLHLILKPFMLRRVKKDVENELTDKLEVLVYCPLTIRQKLLYMGLKRKINIEDLLKQQQGFNNSSRKSLAGDGVNSSLMNLVMQFRKVCNHPELFERREAKSPFAMKAAEFALPKLLFRESLETTRHRRRFENDFCVFNPQNVHKNDALGFLRFIDVSPQELFDQFYSLIERYKALLEMRKRKRNLLNIVEDLNVDSALMFTSSDSFLHHIKWTLKSMPESQSHFRIRARHSKGCERIEFVERPEVTLKCLATSAPIFLTQDICPRVAVSGRLDYAYDRSHAHQKIDHLNCSGFIDVIKTGNEDQRYYSHVKPGGISGCRPKFGFSNIVIPDKQSLVSDSGKLHVLDGLLTRLKHEGHRVLIYSQMTRMIDLLEEYMWHRKHTYMRLDGSSKISDRRDMVADFQTRSDIFVFLLSTRAGGLGINLTAADTVIFYDSDWNPTVDQQAMDRAHRLGQTKQVTVYRLICKGTIEERILQRAKEKSEIQRMVIQGGSFKGKSTGGELKPKEVVSLLLDEDEEIERKYEEASKRPLDGGLDQPEAKRLKVEDDFIEDSNSQSFFDMSYTSENSLSSRPTSRPTSPLLDFMGESLQPKKAQKKSAASSSNPGSPPKRVSSRTPKANSKFK